LEDKEDFQTEEFIIQMDLEIKIECFREEEEIKDNKEDNSNHKDSLIDLLNVCQCSHLF